MEVGSSGSGGPVAVVAGVVDPCASRSVAGRPGLRGWSGRYRPRTTAHDCLWWSGMKCCRAGDTAGRDGPDQPLRGRAAGPLPVRHCLCVAAWAGPPPASASTTGRRTLTDGDPRTRGTPRCPIEIQSVNRTPLSPSQSRSNQVKRHCAWVGYGHMGGLLRLRVVSVLLSGKRPARRRGFAQCEVHVTHRDSGLVSTTPDVLR